MEHLKQNETGRKIINKSDNKLAIITVSRPIVVVKLKLLISISKPASKLINQTSDQRTRQLVHSTQQTSNPGDGSSVRIKMLNKRIENQTKHIRNTCELEYLYVCTFKIQLLIVDQLVLIYLVSPSRMRLHRKLEITMIQPQPPSGGRGTSSDSSSCNMIGQNIQNTEP